MERSKSITIIFLLAVGFLTSAAQAKTVSVLLQEGLYAEEIEGNLDGAIKIYEQVISESKDTQRAAARATYRIGMCYLKKGEKAKAAEQFQNLISKYPEQKTLITKSQEQLKKLGPLTVGVFGPVMERVINDDGEEKNCLIDFDTGRLFSHSIEIPSEEAFLRWVAEKRIDAMGETRTSGPGLYGFDMAAIPIATERWETISPKELAEDLSIAKVGTPAFMSAAGKLPVAYIFKTREGGMGVIQILEMQHNKKPRHFRIRYKMLLDQAKTGAGGWRKVFLPDADTKGTDVVLDFASGELLPAGEGDHQLVGTFAELGKGDLAYDRVLICLRGAKAELIMPDHAVYDLGEHLVRLKVLEQVEDVTAYQLDIGHIPGRYLVTTGEEKDYEVNILSADARGVELIYKKANGYKLVERRFEFSPEIERIMQAQGQRDCWIDFDTGRTYAHPVEVVRNGDEKDIIAWARLHGIDAVATYTISGLASHDMTAVRLDESDWNHLTPSQLAKAVSRRDAQIKPVKIDGFDFIKLTSIPGSTFGFKTREGGLGILQAVDFMKEPWRIKIRYKMLQPGAGKEMVKLKLTKPVYEWWQIEPSVTNTIYEDSQLEIVWDVEPEMANKILSFGGGVLPMKGDISDIKDHLWWVEKLAFTVRRTPYGKKWGRTEEPKPLKSGEYRIYICAFDDTGEGRKWRDMLKQDLVGAATAKLIVRPRPSTQIATPREVKLHIDLSTPEATIKSFVKAVYVGNLEAAKACVSKDGHDYEEFMEMLATESNHPFQAMIKAMDTSIPVEITSKDITEDRCKIKWCFTLGKVYYIGDGETKWKKGMHPEFSSYLEHVGDKWLIRDI